MTEFVIHEIEQIRKCVTEYVNGVVDFDFERGMNPWHPEGLKISYNPETKVLVRETILQTRPILTIEEIEQAKTLIKQRGDIVSIERTGNAAAVKLIWSYEKQDTIREYTDYILLLKIEGDWKIVAKVFHINTKESL